MEEQGAEAQEAVSGLFLIIYFLAAEAYMLMEAGAVGLQELLHLAGFPLSLDEIKNFRQWDSRTPGHPEYGHTVGVETTTGPLGQGFANGVGMAIAEQFLAETSVMKVPLY